LQGRRAAVILTGQNIDRVWMQTVLAGRTPRIGQEIEPRASRTVVIKTS
jgi:hypothetical protein